MRLCGCFIALHASGAVEELDATTPPTEPEAVDFAELAARLGLQVTYPKPKQRMRPGQGARVVRGGNRGTR